MEGVNVLATTVIQPNPIFEGYLLVVLCGIGVIISVLWTISIDKFFPIFFTIGFLLLSFVGVDTINDRKVHTQFIVTVSDSVSVKSFNDKYNIISQNGELYTIEEK